MFILKVKQWLYVDLKRMYDTRFHNVQFTTIFNREVQLNNKKKNKEIMSLIRFFYVVLHPHNLSICICICIYFIYYYDELNE